MLTLIIAILFTLVAAASTLDRKRRYWWTLTALFALAALINWLRYFEIM